MITSAARLSRLHSYWQSTREENIKFVYLVLVVRTSVGSVAVVHSRQENYMISDAYSVRITEGTNFDIQAFTLLEKPLTL